MCQELVLVQRKPPLTRVHGVGQPQQITGRVSRCSLVDLDMVMDGESHGESRENVSAILAAEPVVPFGKAKAGGAEDLIVVGNEW